MPVRFDDYDPDDRRIDLSEGTNAHLILSFLVGHAEYGFTPKEIHEETGVVRGSVSPTLIRLREQELVRHKGDRWAAPTDDRLTAYQGMQVSLEAVSERHSEDWYATTPDWDEETEDLREIE